MTYAPNATSRLVAILESLTDQPPNKNVATAWANVFEMEAAATGVLLEQVGSLLRLEQEAREEVAYVIGEENEELHLQPFNKLERALSRMNFETPAKQLINEVSAALVGLRYSADLVNRARGSGEFDEDQLAELQASVNALLESVLESDIDEEAKRLLTRRLREVRDAIFEIRLWGPDGLEQALDALYGSVARTKPATEDTGLFDRFKSVLDAGYKIVSMAAKLKILIPAAIKLLGPAG